MRRFVLFLLLIAFTVSGCITYDPDFRRRRVRTEREEERFEEQYEEPVREVRRPGRRRRGISRIEPGTVEISGDLDLSFTSIKTEVGGEETADIDTTTVDTSLLYYIAPDLGLGFVFFAEDADVTSGGVSTDVKTVALGPLISKNIVINDLTNFRLTGSFFFADVEITTSAGDSGKADGFGLGLGAGVSYFVTDSVSVNTGLSYVSFSLDEKSTNIDVDIDGLSLGVGLSVYLR